MTESASTIASFMSDNSLLLIAGTIAAVWTNVDLTFGALAVLMTTANGPGTY